MKEFNNHTLYRARFQTLQHRLCASTMFVFVLNLLCFRPTSILCTFVRLSIELQNQTDGWETLFAKHVHLTQQARVRLYCEWMENQQHTRRLSITAFKNKYVDCSCSKCLVLFGFFFLFTTATSGNKIKSHIALYLHSQQTKQNGLQPVALRLIQIYYSHVATCA